MIFTHLTTKNFKKLGTASFDFTNGMNFIVGDNGQGKSTLLRALSTALYGVASLPGVAGDVATWGQSSWSVELEFSHKGEDYTVKRTKSSAHLQKGDEIFASGHTPVTHAIEDLLGLTLKDFNLLIHSQQGETAYILKYGATALQRKVEELSGADHVEKVIGLAKDKAKESQAVADSISHLVPDARELKGWSEEVKELKGRRGDLEGELKRLDEVVFIKLEEPTSDVSALKGGLRKYQSYLSDVREVEARRSEIHDQLGEIVIPESPGEEAVQRLEDDRKTAVSNLSEAKKSKTLREHLTKERESLGEPQGLDLSEALATEETAFEQHEDARSITMDLQRSIKTLKARIKDGVCPECGTVLKHDLDEDKAELVVREREFKVASEKFERAREALSKAHSEVSEAKEDVNLVQRINEVEGKLKALPETADIEALKASVEKATQAYNEAQQATREREQAEKSRAKLQRKLDDISVPQEPEKVTEFQVDVAEAEWEGYRNKKAEQDSERQEHRHQVEITKTSLGSLDEKLETMEAKLKESRDRIDEYESTVNLVDLCSRLATYLRGKRETFLGEVWGNITSVASSFLSEATDGWITGARIEDGKFLFEEKGAWISAAEASGAQAAFLGVALRSGIKAVTGGSYGLAVYDEPTEAMTEANSRNLVSCLGEGSGQVLIVTHRETDQGLADNLITL